MDVSKSYSGVFSDSWRVLILFTGFTELTFLGWVPVNSESLQSSSVLLKGLGVGSLWEACKITGCHGP